MSAAAAPGPLLIDVEGKSLTDDDCRLLADPAVGGAILFTRNYTDRRQLGALTAAMRAVRPNLLIVADYEGGRVQRFRDGFTPIPPMRALGRAYLEDPEAARAAARELAWLAASELRSAGVDMPLAPVADLDYGVSDVIGSRALAETADAVADLAAIYARGLAEAGSAATAKHFPGHGYVAADSHAELPVDDRPRGELERDWAPFAALIDQGIASVMMAHVRFTAVDERPASLSSRWIDGILRGELGFDGCVFCDDLSMGGAAALGDYAQRTRGALAAGCDYLPVCNDREAALVARRIVADGAPDAGRERRAALGDRLDRSRRHAEPDPAESDPGRLRAAREIAAQLMSAA
ncbi:beta-N-acetylhexosaminidase [Salinisphaera sp.]|uniref:beta-N-acetylhexosaminidase n=1 Tax=Salinisphaera sp. TaxID=1914330 RepID=UPI002D78960B|nr:beta-N-acetylhexosaminidase [Salinisphaera sp.]HET7314700.1 beta-N-acetylhexosaminidase [Salinisphaera sp.]